MAQVDRGADRRTGWQWGMFRFRVPFVHTRLCWPEFLQGTALASATGLALVPMMTAQRKAPRTAKPRAQRKAPRMAKPMARPKALVSRWRSCSPAPAR